MWSNHPEIAKRWAALTDRASLPERAKDSRGVPPKRRTDHTDFKPLHPGPKARLKLSKPASETQAMSEGHGIDFQPGSRGHQLNQRMRRKGG